MQIFSFRRQFESLLGFCFCPVFNLSNPAGFPILLLIPRRRILIIGFLIVLFSIPNLDSKNRRPPVNRIEKMSKAVGGQLLFRCVIMGPPDFGKLAKMYIAKGNLVPDSLISEIMENQLHDQSAEPWLLDGFPRTVEQASFLHTRFPPSAVIDLNVPFSVIVERLKKRWIHPGSGRIYNLDYNPPKQPGLDDVTGEVLVQREDDRPETVQNRLEGYKAWEKPIADFYSDLDLLTQFTGNTTNEIWPHVYEWLSKKTEPVKPMTVYTK